MQDNIITAESVKSFGKIQGNEMNIAILCNQVSLVLEQSDERCSGRASWAKSKSVRDGFGENGI